MNIILSPTYHELLPFIQQLPQLFDHQGVTIYQKRNTVKVLAYNTLQLNVKKYHTPISINKIVYSTGIRKPKGLRAYQYAATLLKNNISTPEPVAYIENRKHGLINDSYLVTIQLDNRYTLYEIPQMTPEQYTPIADALGKYTAEMHQKNILHKDYSPGNILFQQNNNQYNFTIVDINRMYFGHVSTKKGLRNLRKLWGTKDFFTLVVKAYAKQRNINTQKAVEFALNERKKFWKKYSKKHQIPFQLQY